jgi:hypothetical protein
MWETKRVRNKFSVCGPIFKRDETTSWQAHEEVSARLKFWARGPLILRLHDKN